MGPMGPMGPWTHGPMGPMGPWAHGPMYGGSRGRDLFNSLPIRDLSLVFLVNVWGPFCVFCVFVFFLFFWLFMPGEGFF